MSYPLNRQLTSTMMVLSFCVMAFVRGSEAQDVVRSGGIRQFQARVHYRSNCICRRYAECRIYCAGLPSKTRLG